MSKNNGKVLILFEADLLNRSIPQTLVDFRRFFASVRLDILDEADALEKSGVRKFSHPDWSSLLRLQTAINQTEIDISAICPELIERDQRIQNDAKFLEEYRTALTEELCYADEELDKLKEKIKKLKDSESCH